MENVAPSIFMGVFAVICFACGWGFSKFRRIEIHNVKELRIDVEKLVAQNLSFLPTERAADTKEQNGHIAQQTNAADGPSAHA